MASSTMDMSFGKLREVVKDRGEWRAGVWGALSVAHSSSLLWSLLPVGGDGQVSCQGFLVRGACICVLVGEVGSLLSGVQ